MQGPGTNVYASIRSTRDDPTRGGGVNNAVEYDLLSGRVETNGAGRRRRRDTFSSVRNPNAEDEPRAVNLAGSHASQLPGAVGADERAQFSQQFREIDSAFDSDEDDENGERRRRRAGTARNTKRNTKRNADRNTKRKRTRRAQPAPQPNRQTDAEILRDYYDEDDGETDLDEGEFVAHDVRDVRDVRNTRTEPVQAVPPAVPPAVPRRPQAPPQAPVPPAVPQVPEARPAQPPPAPEVQPARPAQLARPAQPPQPARKHVFIPRRVPAGGGGDGKAKLTAQQEKERNAADDGWVPVQPPHIERRRRDLGEPPPLNECQGCTIPDMRQVAPKLRALNMIRTHWVRHYNGQNAEIVSVECAIMYIELVVEPANATCEEGETEMTPWSAASIAEHFEKHVLLPSTQQKRDIARIVRLEDDVEENELYEEQTERQGEMIPRTRLNAAALRKLEILHRMKWAVFQRNPEKMNLHSANTLLGAHNSMQTFLRSSRRVVAANPDSRVYKHI